MLRPKVNTLQVAAEVQLIASLVAWPASCMQPHQHRVVHVPRNLRRPKKSLRDRSKRTKSGGTHRYSQTGKGQPRINQTQGADLT